MYYRLNWRVKKLSGPLTRQRKWRGEEEEDKTTVHCQCHSQLTSVEALEKRTDVQRVTHLVIWWL